MERVSHMEEAMQLVNVSELAVNLNPLGQLAEIHVPEVLINFLAPATQKQYEGSWRWFKVWCSHKQISFFPATPDMVATFTIPMTLFHKIMGDRTPPPATLPRQPVSVYDPDWNKK